MPNGVRPDYWTPPGDGEDYEFTPHLKPLESLKSDFLLLENLWNKNTSGRNGHWPKVPAWLSGGYVERTTGGDLDSGGTTVDQFAAPPYRRGNSAALPRARPRSAAHRHRYRRRRLPARSTDRFSRGRDPHTPVPKEIVPQLAFDRLFRNNKRTLSPAPIPKHPSLIEPLQRD